jgi:hypothetical protein
MGEDDRPRRPGSMSDADRALAGRRHRTPAGGVPVEHTDADSFTPVTDLLDMIDDPQLRRIVRLMWEHTANMEMRAQKRVGTEGDVEQLGAAVAVLEGEITRLRNQAATQHSEHVALRELAIRQFADLTGADGKNGKVGTLRERVAKLVERSWWLFTVAVGGLGAAAVKLVIVGRAYGELETQVHSNAARLELLENVVFVRSQLSHPAVTPGKDSP